MLGDWAEAEDVTPSDALVLAVRVGAPIYVAEEVKVQAGRSPQQLPEELACPAPDEEGPVSGARSRRSW